MIKHALFVVVYQPLLNLLVLIYNHMPFYKDMGIALIVFVVLLHLLLTPLRRAEQKAGPAQDRLVRELEELERRLQFEPAKLDEERRKLLKQGRKTLNLRTVDLVIEGIYFVTLWKIFVSGFSADQLSHLYSFVKYPIQPMNLTFLHLFDLTVVSPMLNLISAVGLFVVLILHYYWQEATTGREEYLVLFGAPLAAYFISSRLPAGQEFFFTILEVIELMTLIVGQYLKLQQKKETLTARIYLKGR